MTTPPGNEPPILDYGKPKPLPSSAGCFVMVLSAVIGLVGSVIALFAAFTTGSSVLFFLPLVLALLLVVLYALALRKRGYPTGVVIAPIILTLGIVLITATICGV